jgi:hypothetical protein
MDNHTRYVENIITQRRNELRAALKLLNDEPGETILAEVKQLCVELPRDRAEALAIVARELDAGNSVLAHLLPQG